jgi:hypothetical protein
MSLRPTAIAEERDGIQGLYVVIDDPDTTGALLIPISFEHRRVISRADLTNRFELHPARSPQQSVPDTGEGER